MRIVSIFFILSQSFAQDVVWLPKNNPNFIPTNIKTIENEAEPFLSDFKSFIHTYTTIYDHKLNHLKIKILSEEEHQTFLGNAICKDEIQTIEISRMKWILSTKSEKQQLIDHEIGHCIFGMIHTKEKNSIMQVHNFEYSNDSDKKNKRLRMLFNGKHNLLPILKEKIKNIHDLNKIQEIEDSLNKN